MSAASSDLFIVISVVTGSAAVVVSIVLYLLVRESKHRRYDEDRHRVELEVMRKSLEEQLYRLNERLVATDARWRDVNHLLISAQQFASPQEDQSSRRHPKFLERAGVAEGGTDKDLVFVLTPFHPDFESTYENIASVCGTIGLKCMRGDEEHVTGDVLQHILQLITRSRVVIANLDGRNPNVFYELGIAQALDKPVLSVSSTPEGAPFDVRTNRIIFWQNSQELRQKLRDELLKIFVSSNK